MTKHFSFRPIGGRQFGLRSLPVNFDSTYPAIIQSEQDRESTEESIAPSDKPSHLSLRGLFSLIEYSSIIILSDLN